MIKRLGIKIKNLQFWQNAAALSASAIIIRGIGLLSNIYITSAIGAEGIGLNTLIGSVYGFALTLATSGVNLAAVRLCGEKGDVSAVLKVCLRYALLFSLTSALILFTFAGQIGNGVLHDVRTVLPLRILAFALPAVSVSSVLNGVFVGSGKGYKNAAVQLIEQICKLLLTVTALSAVKGNLALMCAAAISATALGEIIQLAVAVLIYRRTKKNNNIKIQRVSVKFSDAASIALPVAIGAYARSALLTIEHLAIPWGLRMNANPEFALASYGTLHGMALPVVLFPMAVSGAVSVLLIPEVASSRVNNNYKRIKRITEKALCTVFLYSLTVACVIFTFADFLGMSLFNHQDAGMYMRMLAPLIPVMYLDGATDAVLKSLGLQVYSMGVNIIDSALSVALVLILIPRFGIIGYAITVYVAEILNMALSAGRLFYELNVKDNFKNKKSTQKKRVPEAARTA